MGALLRVLVRASIILTEQTVGEKQGNDLNILYFLDSIVKLIFFHCSQNV